MRRILLALWAGALFGLGWAVGILVTFVLFSAAAVLAGYQRGRE